MTKLKPYPAYKDSGLPWLHEIPTDWEVKRLDRLFSLRKESPYPLDNRVTAYLDGRVTLRSNVTGQKIKGVTKETGWQRVYPGDFAISGMNAHLGGMGVSDSLGKCSPIYLVLKPLPYTNARFVSHAVRHFASCGALKSLVNTIRFNSADLKKEDLKSIPVWLPADAEQKRIVSFIDNIERAIRRYVRAKRRVIELLVEQKQAIIQRAVTRGIDPNVRLRPSGIDWLDDVPEHWNVMRVKQCAQIISKGTTPSTEGREILDSGPVRFLKAENIAGGRIVEKPLYFIDEGTNAILKRSQLQAGDVLFVIAGATLGKTAVVQEEFLPANTNQAVAFIRPNTRVTPFYLASWLQSRRVNELTWLNAVQSAQPNLSMEDLGGFVIFVPTINEQRAILLWLQEALKELDSAIERAQCQINLIREYRTRLIADVVTGKLDVRGVELPGLDEAGEELIAEEDTTEDVVALDEELETADEHADVVD